MYVHTLDLKSLAILQIELLSEPAAMHCPYCAGTHTEANSKSGVHVSYSFLSSNNMLVCQDTGRLIEVWIVPCMCRHRGGRGVPSNTQQPQECSVGHQAVASPEPATWCHISAC